LIVVSFGGTATKTRMPRLSCTSQQSMGELSAGLKSNLSRSVTIDPTSGISPRRQSVFFKFPYYHFSTKRHSRLDSLPILISENGSRFFPQKGEDGLFPNFTTRLSRTALGMQKPKRLPASVYTCQQILRADWILCTVLQPLVIAIRCGGGVPKQPEFKDNVPQSETTHSRPEG
jgi:hypothetical protein